MGNRLFEKFDIIECLKCDIATVYIAHHIYLDKDILLKTLDTRNISNPLLLQRFQREAKTLARLDHPNIIKVLDFGTYEKFFYISFEYFKSCNLRHLLKDGGMKLQAVDAVFQQICSGMQYAHDHHIIHRDLKPENILIDASGHVKIADFGLALIYDDPKVTMQSGIVGTPGYMSPEQIRGEELDVKTDIFSLGIVVYEMYCGRNPFLGRDVGQTLHNILNAKEPSEHCRELPEPYRQIVDIMLKPDRKQRMACIADLSMYLSQKDRPVQNLNVRQKRKSGSAIVAAILIFVLAVFMLHRELQKKDLPETQQQFLKASDSLSTADSAITEQSVAEQKTEPEPQTKKLLDINTIEPERAAVGFGGLIVRCSPWARVSIDDRLIDTTPIEDEIRLSPGEHTVEFKHSEYPAYTKNIRIYANKTETIAVNLDTVFGFLQVNVFPWAEIEIDGQMIGRTPLQGPLPLLPGAHVLVFKNQYYSDYSETVEIEKSDTMVCQLNFDNIVR